MKINRNILLIVLILGSINSIAQQAIISSGNVHQNTSGSISWSLGETVTQTFSAGDYTLTQGFQQGDLSVTAIYEKTGIGVNISAYPNPTSSELFVEFESAASGKYSYRLIDEKGNLLEKGKIINTKQRIAFENRHAGLYLLQIHEKSMHVKTFKIFKE